MKTETTENKLPFVPFELTVKIVFETQLEYDAWKRDFNNAWLQSEGNYNYTILYRRNGDGMSCLNKTFIAIHEKLKENRP